MKAEPTNTIDSSQPGREPNTIRGGQEKSKTRFRLASLVAGPLFSAAAHLTARMSGQANWKHQSRQGQISGGKNPQRKQPNPTNTISPLQVITLGAVT